MLSMHSTSLTSLFYFIFLETSPWCVAQAGLELLGSSDPPASATPVAGTTDTYNHT
jgi:hypothetical protein